MQQALVQAASDPLARRQQRWRQVESNPIMHVTFVSTRKNSDPTEHELYEMEFMLRFTLTHPDLHTTIVGTVNPDHLKDNVEAALKGPLPLDVYEEAKRRLS